MIQMEQLMMASAPFKDQLKLSHLSELELPPQLFPVLLPLVVLDLLLLQIEVEVMARFQRLQYHLHPLEV
jgi:hypothetical protein